MKTDEICALPVADMVKDPAHLYLWVANALLPEGLTVMKAWETYSYSSAVGRVAAE